ncbi:molecular chaperone [Morganella morganii]|uniref:fimbrial biogenesis chaperone n=1 Tax=Morganella morganii TaxID=582 RepID=UPI0034E5CBEA
MKFFQKILISGFAVLLSSSAIAGVGLNQTRIIINADTNTSTVTVRNTGDETYLVANYITEQLDKNPVSNNIFVITPQVFKLGGNSANKIKVQAIPGNFPADRESMYYFHSRNVPATNEKTGVKIGFENIIKVFYRPAGLTAGSKESYAGLEIKPAGNGIKLINNSPYYINLQKLKVNQSLIKLSAENNIIAPYSDSLYITPHKNGTVTWFVINELGGTNEYSKNI